MVDKKILKYYFIGLVLTILSALLPAIIMDLTSENMQNRLYILPFGATGGQQAIIFQIMAILLPIPTIFIGYGLAYLVVGLYSRLTKFSKRITFVGYARIDRSGPYLRRRYLLHLIFGALLATNIWVVIVSNPTLMEFWMSADGLAVKYHGSSSTYQQFAYTPWYWAPLVLVVLIFAMCAVIQDTGLVSVKKLSGQSTFEDTERIGDKLFGIVKGYAGISVIISFVNLLLTPLGNELSLVFYPLQAMMYLLHLIIAIDLFREVGRKWIFKAVKHHYNPQLIEMSYTKKDITDINETTKP